MNTLMKILAILIIIGTIASCQPQTTSDILADETLRTEIMDSIANDHELTMEMMDVMMNNEHGKMMLMSNEKMMNMMIGNQELMQNIMKNNPEMMGSMMGTMIHASEGDSTSMRNMCQKIMENPQMKGMMQNMMQQDHSGMGMMN